MQSENEIPALSIIASALEECPWLAPYRALGASVIRAAHTCTVATAFNAVSVGIARQPRFVEPSELAHGEAYEAFIARTRCVPTRNNAHDFFNALVWMKYPQTKWRLNSLQAGHIACHGTRGARGPLRDALTLFDENAALLQAPAGLIDALRQRAWKELFVEGRELWSTADVVLFGHALMEKLLHPRKAITAHVWIVEDVSDAAVAASLQAERLASKPFVPLPVLGVPGWWAENESAMFYDDADVFRPARIAL